MASDSKDGDDAMGGMGVEARPEDLDVLGAPEYETKNRTQQLGGLAPHSIPAFGLCTPTHQHRSDPDTFRIMIATDNHVGYAERDQVRGEDSFLAFEEILQHAVHQRVRNLMGCQSHVAFFDAHSHTMPPTHSRQADFLLLGGDLFHDNKPSRPTYVKYKIICNTVMVTWCHHSVSLTLFSLTQSHATAAQVLHGSCRDQLQCTAHSVLLLFFLLV